jgi:N-acetylmuramoyl-L-alanine amidase
MSLPALKWVPSPNFNSRHGTRVDQIIIHDMEGTYAGSIAYFRTKASDVSAHFCVRGDGGEITQMVHLADRAWHACAANSRSVGIEMEGYSKNGFSDALLTTTAELAAWLCHHLQIPIRHARGGVGPGLESHFGLGVAGGHHFDPFPDPNWIPHGFLPLVQAAYAKGDYDSNWDRAEDPAPCPLDHAHAVPANASAQIAARDRPLDLGTVD